MMKQKFIFLLGVVLVLLSVQNSMFKELVYNWDMNRKYKITELNEMYEGLPSKYQFGTNNIDTRHKLIDAPVYRDPWDNFVQLADVYITINGQQKDVLKYYPVKISEDGLNQYTHYVSYWLIFDKKKKEKSFAIVLKTTREIVDTLDDIIPNEELNPKYRVITVNKDGKVKTEDFSFKNKSKLQTKLIPTMDEGPVGYYTDSWSSYPSFLVFIYPFFYPMATFGIGIILTFSSLILIVIKKYKAKKM